MLPNLRLQSSPTKSTCKRTGKENPAPGMQGTKEKLSGVPAARRLSHHIAQLLIKPRFILLYKLALELPSWHCVKLLLGIQV